MPTVRIPIDLSWVGASGSPGVNVFHGRIDPEEIETGGLDDITEMLHTFYSTCVGIFPDGTTIRYEGEAFGVGDDEGNVYTSPEWTVLGEGNGGFLPPANAILVSWKTGSGGRSGRGRTFLSPIVLPADEENGTPGEPTRASVQGAVDALVASSTGFGNGALGVYSRTQDTFRDFTSGNVPNFFAVLRSRRD